MSLRNLYSYQPYITNIAFKAAPPIWTAMPKSRDTAFVAWSLGNWGVNLQDRWLGGYDQNTTPGQVFLSRKDRHIPNYNQVDVTVDKKFTMDDLGCRLLPVDPGHYRRALSDRATPDPGLPTGRVSCSRLGLFAGPLLHHRCAWKSVVRFPKLGPQA